MSVQIKRRRGTTEEHSFFTGAVGEITVDTTKNTAVVHDGVTVGGHPLAKEAYVEQMNQELRTLMDKALGLIEDPDEHILIGKELRAYYETLRVVNNASGVVDIDYTVANVHRINISGDVTFNMISTHIPTGKAVAISLIVKQAETLKSIIWPANIKWPRYDIPTLPGANMTYVFTLLTTDGGQSWIGLLVGEEIDA